MLVVGAGISGLGAAHALATGCPELTYAIVEGRERLGGTWDLFRYPGIRSDSDMHTLGFSWRPWNGKNAIADGPSILAYLEDTARETGIEAHIRYGLRVESMAWSSTESRWTVRVRRVATGEVVTLTARFVWVCAGYYRYDHGYTPAFEGKERFRGRWVHPQHWPADLEVAKKRVVVIGSGATAVTLVPKLAETAQWVVMLQRSPSYVIALPAEDRLANWLMKWLPARTAHALIRRKNIALGRAFYAFCRRFPRLARRLLRRGVLDALGDPTLVDTHFNPAYEPWDQRLCVVPDGDLFRAIREGRAQVTTGVIARVVEDGLELESGQRLEADVIVSATGLELQFLGGTAVEVDGQPVDLASTRVYMGAMLSGVPNLAFAMGYTNASWTLKCELVADYVTRVLRHMRAHGYARVMPPRSPPGGDRPLVEMTSGYFLRGRTQLPRQGTEDPWCLHQDWQVDRRLYRRHPIEDGVLELS